MYGISLCTCIGVATAISQISFLDSQCWTGEGAIARDCWKCCHSEEVHLHTERWTHSSSIWIFLGVVYETTLYQTTIRYDQYVCLKPLFYKIMTFCRYHWLRLSHFEHTSQLIDTKALNARLNEYVTIIN